MSEFINKQVVCPVCRHESSVDLQCSMNTMTDHRLKEKIFDESFFQWKCPKCGFETALLHPFLYNDLKNKFMIYLIPNVERSRIVDENLEKEFGELTDIRKRLAPDVNTLKEKITIFEGGYDDLAVELSKHAVAEVVGKSTGQTVYEGFCMEINKSENSITFQFFLGGDRRPYIQTTRYDVYQRSFAIVKEFFWDIDTKKGFLNINRAWAKEALKRYKNSV